MHPETNDLETPDTIGVEGEGLPQDGGPATQPGIEGPGGADATAADDWRVGLEDEKVRTFAERFTSPAEAAKAAFELRQKLSNAVEVPGKNASIKEIVEFQRKLGVPESPDQYDVTLPDANQIGDAGKERVQSFLSAMHGAGAPPAVVQTALDSYFSIIAEARENHERLLEHGQRAAEAELRREWGKDFEANIHVAQRAASQFGGERFTRFLENATIDGIRLGDHPEFTRAFAAAGRCLSEDGIHMGTPDHRKNSVQEEIDALQEQKMTALGQGDSDKAARLDARQATLYEQLHGSESIVGAGMRTV